MTKYNRQPGHTLTVLTAACSAVTIALFIGLIACLIWYRYAPAATTESDDPGIMLFMGCLICLALSVATFTFSNFCEHITVRRAGIRVSVSILIMFAVGIAYCALAPRVPDDSIVIPISDLPHQSSQPTADGHSLRGNK